ncbi:hypothetical protein [Levilactobacillus cerevisiae]|uniref:hypothetical protein n=1 Tax=Levilactobacillus cerevisiae TaxID=1704076 RepID=UPI000F797F8B|nr:hypothetical protein [Levilactobacillus cerevisiae]
MTEIKVIGDILSGKFQPTLTGNRIVDAALIDHFCRNLAVALGLPLSTVHAEHNWNLTTDSAQIYLIDDQILAVTDHLRGNGNVIAVAHKDLLRGQVGVTQQELASRLSLHSTAN